MTISVWGQDVYVTLVFKKVDKKDSNNYRPIWLSRGYACLQKAQGRARVRYVCLLKLEAMVQVGYTTRFGLCGIHNLGPVALGCVYPVETSTSLYNLYIHTVTCRVMTHIKQSLWSI